MATQSVRSATPRLPKTSSAQRRKQAVLQMVARPTIQDQFGTRWLPDELGDC